MARLSMVRRRKSTSTTAKSSPNTYRTHGKPIGMLQAGDLRRYCEFITRTNGVGIRFDPNVDTASTDGVTITLPEFNSRMTDADAHRLGAYVVHECAHHRHGRDVFSILRKNRMTAESPLAAIFNIIEDERVNRATNNEYRGDGIRLSDGQYHIGRYVHKLYGDYKKSLPDPDASIFDETSAKLSGVQACQIEASSDWNSGLSAGFLPVLRDYFTRECFDAAETLRDKLDIINTMRALKNTGEAWELAKQAYELLFNKSAEEHLAEQAQALSQAGENGDQDGSNPEGVSGKDGESDGKASAKNGSGTLDINAKPTDGFNPSTGKVRVTDMVLSDHREDRGDVGPGGHGMGYDYTDYTEQHGAWREWGDDIRVVEYAKHGVAKSKDSYSWHDARDFKDWLREVRRSEAAEAGFANKARRLLQVRTAARYEHNQKSGRLYRKAIYRVGVPQVNDGEWNSRIFKKRVTSDVLNTSVLVLVDWSGSMSGTKAAHACDAAVLINEVFSKVLKMPLAVVSHAFYDKPSYGIIKDFDTPASSDMIRERFSDFTHYMSGNDDHDALLFAYRKISGRKSKRRIIIALSDGAPADGADGCDVFNALKETAKSIEESHRVELYGLGIMDDNVKHFYQRNSVLKNADELEARLLDLLSNMVLSTNTTTEV